MEKITLRPFEKLTRRPARSINITELQQLKNSIEKIRDKKLDTPGHAKTLAAELYYLRVIRQIIEQFSGQRKIMKDDLVAAVDRLLRADGWSGRLVQHKIAQGNKFYDFNNSHGPDYALQYYDIAYHSSSLGRGRGAHHYDQEDPALFYYRCETHHDNKTILIGNLQIDAGRLGPDYDAGPAQLSLRHKNLELLMLQSALKHAVTMGKSKVIFPTGAMNEKAQGQPGATGQVLITAQNYEHYHENYKARHRQFNKIFPGERLGCTATGQHELIVLAKTISSAKIWYRKIMGCPNYCGILNLLDNENFSQGTQLIYPPRRKKIITACWQAAQAKNYSALARELATLFTAYGASPRPPSAAPTVLAEVLTQAKNLNTGVSPTRSAYLSALTPYLKRCSYEDLFLAAHPAMIIGGGAEKYYIPGGPERRIKNYPATAIRKPRLGKIYYLSENYGFEALQQHNIFYWYDVQLPRLLTQLGLPCENVSVWKGREKYYGWQVAPNWEKFKLQPLVVG